MKAKLKYSGTNMWAFATLPTLRFLNNSSLSARFLNSSRIMFSVDLENKYSDAEKEKIIQVINDSDAELISKYEITKSRIKYFSEWKSNDGRIQTLSDMHLIQGFSEKIAKKLFDSILKGPVEADSKISNRIRGQILQPTLSPAIVKNCKTILTVYTTVNSVSWTHINKHNYEMLEWKYHEIEYRDTKKLQMTDILEIVTFYPEKITATGINYQAGEAAACFMNQLHPQAWDITKKLPSADIYVMKAEMTTLRAAGNDPNNPKVIAVNLQRAQLVAMLVALINARDHNMNSNELEKSTDTSNKMAHKVYFLRPSLPYRLYGTLVGNERVSTDQTVDMMLQNGSKSNDSVIVSEELISMFRSQKELEKDMLGHCFLLSLTFMDLCIYKNQKRIAILLKQGE